MAAKSITINSLSVQDSNFITDTIIYRNNPSKTLNTFQKNRNDGFVLQSQYYTEKNISVSGNINCSTEADLKTKIDTLKEAVSGDDEFNVDIDDAGNTMRFTCVLESLSIPEKHYHITNVPFSLSLKCQPFGKMTTAVTSTNSITNASSIPYSVSINPTGSLSPKPNIKWEIITGIPTTPITQVILNNITTGDIITVPSLALDAVGDYLKIDCDAMTVFVSHDGGEEVAIDYSGVFPSFLIGNNILNITLTGGGASFSILQTISYYPEYL
jgi:hypothetical protein